MAVQPLGPSPVPAGLTPATAASSVERVTDRPRWLAQVLAVLVDGQDAAAAAEWTRRLDGELERLRGRVPFSVVHDWHAHAVTPMLVSANERRGEDPQVQRSVQRLHLRALAGERVAEAEWVAALEPALREVYRHAYAYADAYATARANAHAYATANGFSLTGAVEFADSYAELNTSANAESYADANAMANARAAAAAYAAADPAAYAESYPFAFVIAVVQGQSDEAEQRRAACQRLADGLVGCLARAGV